MLDKILSHKRFALFAPFLGLAALTLVAFVFWIFAAERMSAQLAAQGLTWSQLNRHGFPARITLTVNTPRWRDGDMLWRNKGFSLTTMPFNGGHAIVDFLGPHRIDRKADNFSLAHQGNLMSIVADGDGFLRGSFEAQKPHLTGQWQGLEIDATGDILGLHGRRNGTQVELAVVLKNLYSKTPAVQFSRFDMATTVPPALLTQGPSEGQMLVLDRLTLAHGAVTLVARGRVKLRPAGQIDGKIDLDIVNLTGFIDALIEARLINGREKRRLLLLGSLGAALGGDTQDRLSLPLRLANGRLLLGPIDIGAAPRWQ